MAKAKKPTMPAPQRPKAAPKVRPEVAQAAADPSLIPQPTMPAMPAQPGTTQGMIPADNRSMQIGADGQPLRPDVAPEIKNRTKAWWDETNNGSDNAEACRVVEEMNKALFPAKYDGTDPRKGRRPAELKTREDNRRVNIPLAYRTGMQTVAMTCPDEYSMRWKPNPTVPGPNDQKSKTDQKTLAFARTVEIGTERYFQEANWEANAEAWIWDSFVYPLSIVKLIFKRDYLKDPITQSGEQRDEQDNLARYRLLREKVARGEIHDHDAEMAELNTIQESLGGSSEIEMFQGFSIEVISMKDFRYDANVPNLESVYNGAWMSQDVWMTRDDVRQKFPFVMKADGTPTGVHPDDLMRASVYMDNGNPYGQDGKSKRDQSYMPIKDQRGCDRLRVREIHAKRENKILILVEGVEYPAAEWVPKRTPSQWYVFHLLVMNRVPFQVAGVSDVELLVDIQARMNRKWSDEEKARWLSLPRGIFASELIDKDETIKLSDIKPGTMKGIKTAGEIDKIVKWLEYKYPPEAFNTEKDENMFQRMAAQPPQLTGEVGSANFSSEVKSAMQGADISSRFRKKTIGRAFSRLYTAGAEVLLQELRPEDWKAVAGQHAVMPRIYGEREGKALMQELTLSVRKEVGVKMEQMTVEATMSGNPEAVKAVEAQFQEQVAQVLAERVQIAFGFPEPLTREAIYRRLRCTVRPNMNGSLDKTERVKNIVAIFESLAKAATAAQAAGMGFNPRPFMRTVSQLLDEDDDVSEMFDLDPNALVLSLQTALAEDPGALQPDAAMQLIQMAQAIATAMAQAQAQIKGGAIPGPGAAGAPAPGGASPATPAPAKPPAQAPAAPSVN